MTSAPNDPGPPAPGAGDGPGPDAAEAAGLGDLAWAGESGAGAADADADAGGASPGGDEAEGPISVEDLVQDLERVTNERDQYLDTSRRIQAEFENYRKAAAKREADHRERANESIVAELLPVLDACDGAVASGATDVEPVRAALIDVLTKQGLDVIAAADEPFDPSLHEAVMHEPGESDDKPVVAEVLRAGYTWKGRVVRPAMVRVKG